jgi:F-type H+-transporting ATPase subunit a
MKKRGLLVGALALGASGSAFAGEGLPEFINYYEMILHSLGLEERFEPVLGAILAVVILAVVGLFFRKSVESSLNDVVPAPKFSLRVFVEILMDFVYGITKDQCGAHFRNFLGLLSSIFLFILVSNLTGLIPGLPPPTENMSTNVAIGIIAFLSYNIAGLKENGTAYLKHFLGPVAFIAPLYLGIEIFSHLSRPLSLGLRLTGNIFGDHLLLGVFTGLTYLVFPALLLFFGLLVACIQSFVFTLLTGIYISMAIAHDH